MKKCLIVLSICSVVLFLSMSPRMRDGRYRGVEQTLDYFRVNASSFAESTADLQQSIKQLDKNNPASVDKAITSLKECRLRFKNIEFFFNYFFRSLSVIYNAPAVVEVEEPFLEYREPIGLQVIASLLFADDPFAEKEQLVAQASLVYEAAGDLHALLYQLPVTDEQVLESIQLELINVMTLGIAGFDTPELKTGISESKQTLLALQEVLQPFLTSSKESDSVRFYMNAAIEFIHKNESFDVFDRLGFLTGAALPLQECLRYFIRKEGLELNTTGVLNYKTVNIFRPGAIDINHTLEVDSAMAALGKTLFFEKALSGNRTRSCATCHQPEKYFTDGLVKSIALDGHSTVQRNSPTLLYAAFQYSQFWDGRVKHLEEQIKDVLQNPVEMNADHQQIITYLKTDKHYAAKFDQLFGNTQKDSTISIANVASSIAAFIKTLAPFQSPFDRYMNGDKTALTKEQVNGFNLFMGKAMCGTCHTAPMFNGLTPPLYERTVLEIVGTTNSNNFTAPALSADSGRYATYPIDFYMGAFKTPGLRNVAHTAPYMHNGALSTLEDVLVFYNKGGGQGLGLHVPNQTLSGDSLQLSTAEMANVISFLHSLSDPQYSFR
ncbi:MAG: cytochrome C peroxidase [Chitinophagaceae bacterium]|nr:cytochrome C peroxidase [Chitinophagaceae bacterium]